MGLIGQWDGLGQGHFEGIGWDAAQEGHGIGAPEEGVILSRFSGDRIVILVLQRRT